MRPFLTFWWKSARIAAKGSTAFANDWQWLFGIPAVTGFANYAAVRLGKSALTSGSPLLDGLLAATGAFILTWLLAFLVRLFNAPALIERQQSIEIERLKALVGEVRPLSFKLRIEEIHVNDPDRSRYGSGEENLFRVAITNLHDRPLETYAVLENLSPELGYSPAAHLPAMGKENDSPTFHIAGSETAYVLLLKKHTERDRIFGEVGEEDFSPWMAFATTSSKKNSFIDVIDIRRREGERIGELEKGHTYSVTVAVHGIGAVSSRLNFSVEVAEDGAISLTSQT